MLCITAINTSNTIRTQTGAAGAQQQTRCTPLLLSISGTGTDGQTDEGKIHIRLGIHHIKWSKSVQL